MCKGTFSQKELQQNLNSIRKKRDKVASDPLIEGIDIKLLNKVKVISGSISPLKDKKQHNIAISVMTDDYGNPQNMGISQKSAISSQCHILMMLILLIIGQAKK